MMDAIFSWCARRAGADRTFLRVPAFVTALSFGMAAHIAPASAQVAAQADRTVFTVIVTRHGVRAPSGLEKSKYEWATWGEVKPDELTAHGYRLMRLMGRFYAKTQSDKRLPVDCPGKSAYVYADTAQRTLGTAHALIEGLCGSPDALEVFHAAGADGGAAFKDPMFDATEWLLKQRKIDILVASRAAVVAAAGSPSSSLVMRHKDEFATFQRLLDSRCPDGGCQPIAAAASVIQVDNLAGLKGPIATASTYAEDVYLEFAQCRPEDKLTSLDGKELRTALQAGMRLHVLAYDVNARNRYNPLVRGGTLLAHVVAMLGQKAGRREVLGRIRLPDLDGKTLVILSGHDTELGSLGGILDAHWDLEGGNMRDDMPPGSALIFDLVKRGNDYGVHLGFVSMALDQYRNEKSFDGPLAAVHYPGCTERNCVMPLAQFESLALTLDAQGLVDESWDASPSRLPQDPGSSANLKDPPWTEPKCRGP
jgi:4-phytase/acid phosphatase